MTDREKFLLRMAVIYLIANRDDACEAFEHEGVTFTTPCGKGRFISVNGDIDPEPDESELDHLMRTLQ